MKICNNGLRNDITFQDKIKLTIIINLVKLYFFLEKGIYKNVSINSPKEQFILSLWHNQQWMIYGIEDKSKLYTLISVSNDGEIIAKAAESLGIKSVRGSAGRHGVAGSIALLEKLKEGNNVAITVDGPTGPVYKVKEGIINIAKLSGVPIVPCAWYSPEKSLVEFPTWDKFKVTIGPCTTVTLYGEPIKIPPETTKEEAKQWCIKIEEEMLKLQKDVEENYYEYRKKREE